MFVYAFLGASYRDGDKASAAFLKYYVKPLQAVIPGAVAKHELYFMDVELHIIQVPG